MNGWAWAAAGVLAGGVLLLAMRLWGAQIVAGLVRIAASKAWEAIKPVITDRMTPEQEKAWRDCQRSGGRWNHVKKRCEPPR